jgi:hypothetical protein
MKFAMEGAQHNGEFFTPPSLVQTIVNIIEPEHGVVFDPAAQAPCLSNRAISSSAWAGDKPSRHVLRPGEDGHNHPPGQNEPRGPWVGG